jgi:inorganic triphosphatase YgiF
LEIEAKLQAPNQLALHQLPAALDAEGFYVTDPGLVYSTDHYLDTEDLHLRAAGWALRVRDLGTRKLVTLKALRPVENGLAKREELEEQAPEELRTDWLFPSHTLGGKLQELLGCHELRRLFIVEQTRNIYTAIGQDGLQLEVSSDAVTWIGEGVEDKAFQVELELKKGNEDELRCLYLRLMESLGWTAAPESKYERGLRVVGLLAS